MNQSAAYLTGIITIGSFSLMTSLQHWDCADPLRFATYLLLAILAGTLKVRLPGMTGTYSLTFLFVLIGIEELTRGETTVLACVSMIVQCLWNTAEPPRPVQIAFNVAASAASVAISFSVAQSAPAHGSHAEFFLRLVLGAAIYYVTNTLLVSGILAIEERKPLGSIWRQWFNWSVRYYLVGVATALIILEYSRYMGWMYSLILLPVMYVEYLCLRLNVRSHQRSGTHS